MRDFTVGEKELLDVKGQVEEQAEKHMIEVVAKNKELVEKNKDLVDKITEDCNTVIVPRQLGFLEKQLQQNGSAWLAGTKGPSIADYFWVPVLRSLQGGWSGDKEILGKFPALVDLINRFMALPEVAEYYKNHEN